jgi:hypothetical protein
MFSVSEDLAGITDAVRWKSRRMPLADNRNLTAGQGAASRPMINSEDGGNSGTLAHLP